jgi:hypothetical protein
MNNIINLHIKVSGVKNYEYNRLMNGNNVVTTKIDGSIKKATVVCASFC